MPPQRVATNKRVLARIQRLCCLGMGSEMLMPDLMREVDRLVPSRNGSFFWIGSNREIANAYTQLPLSILQLYFTEFYRSRHESDVIMTLTENMTSPSPNLVGRISHSLRVDHQTFLRSDFYNVFWRAAECYEPLMLRVRERGRDLGALWVYRAEGDAPFEPRDVRILESIAGFVAHAMTSATLAEAGLADSDDRALFMTNLAGGVLHASEQAQHLLMMAFLPFRSPAADWHSLGQPRPEIVALCRALTATANGEIGQQPPVLRLRNPWGEFVLRAYWFGPTDGVEQTRQIGITIERQVPRALALRRRVEELPLTGREKQLCLLLAHDRPRRDVADAMGVSAGTVITHQSSIYAKLGVHSRAELLAALLPG